MKTDATNFATQLKSCWATPDSNPNNPTRYEFISDFCGDESEGKIFNRLKKTHLFCPKFNFGHKNT